MKHQQNKGKICRVPECNNMARVKGLCMKCYGIHKRKEKKEDLHSIIYLEVSGIIRLDLK